LEIISALQTCTKGEKQALSISLTRSSYARRFSRSLVSRSQTAFFSRPQEKEKKRSGYARLPVHVAGNIWTVGNEGIGARKRGKLPEHQKTHAAYYDLKNPPWQQHQGGHHLLYWQ